MARRTWWLCGFMAVLLSGLISPAINSAAAEDQLNLYIWSEYIDPDIIKSFEQKFKCKVVIDLYEDNESMLAKIEGGGSSRYDIVVPSDYVVNTLVRKNLLAKLDKTNIPNMANIEDRFASPPYDPGNVYTAPYQWGTVGLYVRKKPGQQIEESWSLMFDPSKQVGPFVMIDSMRENISAALKYTGHSVNTTDEQPLKKARDMLIEAKKRSLGFDGGVGGKNKVLAHSAAMATVYNGDAVRGMGEDEETYYFVPKEGGEIWMDNMAIPVKAPHKLLAEKFINYILDADIGAQLSNFNQYATPNKAAKAKIKPEDLANTAIYPTDEIMSKLEFLHDLGDKSRLFDEIWTQIKSN
jgi:spermidine/putrescine transport system substrate-binding protein